MKTCLWVYSNKPERKTKPDKPRDIWDISKDEEYMQGLNTIQYQLKCDMTTKKKNKTEKGERPDHMWSAS